MPLDTYESILKQFPPVSPEAWKQKILRDLKDLPLDSLNWHTKEGIDVLPFYSGENNKLYQLAIPPKSTEAWLITERIIADDISKANLEALQALEMGATAILFDLQHKALDPEAATVLVKDILTDIVSVFFENFREEDKENLECMLKGSCTDKIRVPQRDSLAEELASVLQEGVRQIGSGNSDRFVFHFFISTNYFFEMAKLRAFRWLWKQVCDLQEIPFNVFIFSESDVSTHVSADEYTNIMRNTTEAMSAVLGGSDALILNAHDAAGENSGFGKRIARNIQHILQLESYFAGLEDPAKGSYYIEFLTYSLAEKAWQQFKQA